mmetsp:Transcript_58468/g.137767  ORF Transcript_58468/g.137767 Transcript_58468/m.137767 type:complete len:114 (+) Transcript_58468:591-932(+)
MSRHHGVEMNVASDLTGGGQTTEAIQKVHAYLHSVSHWELAALDAIAGVLKSVAIALFLTAGETDARNAVKIARVGEDYQISRYGLVEGGHDLDLADYNCRVATAELMSRLSR